MAIKIDEISALIKEQIKKYTEDLKTIFEDVEMFAKVVDTGRLPLIYNLSSDNYIQSQITEDVLTISVIIFSVALFI